jgi:hypothetical protein
MLPQLNSHYKPHTTKAVMQCMDFAAAVAFEFIDSRK